MLKKYGCLFLCAVMIFLSCGCTALLEDKYFSTSPHKPADDSSEISEITFSASTYSELCNALSKLVESHLEKGIIKFESYSGNLEEDLSKACIYVSKDTPIGSYTINHINSTLNKIVSFYEADITVTYNKTIYDVMQIKDVENEEELENALLTAASGYNSSLAIHTSETSINSDAITKAISALYYSRPDALLYLPKFTITTHPEEKSERILEILFEYPFSSSVLKERAAALDQRSQELIGDLGSYSGDAALEYLCKTLDSIVAFDQASDEADEYDRWVSSYTAYGPLVLGKAAGEGYAMAMKLLCNMANLECYVVRGRLNSITHAWNIVRLENDKYYHLDISRYDGGILFRNDAEMSAEQYWWDSSIYVPCDGISVNSDIPDSDEPALSTNTDFNVQTNQQELSQSEDHVELGGEPETTSNSESKPVT